MKYCILFTFLAATLLSTDGWSASKLNHNFTSYKAVGEKTAIIGLLENKDDEFPLSSLVIFDLESNIRRKFPLTKAMGHKPILDIIPSKFSQEFILVLGSNLKTDTTVEFHRITLNGESLEADFMEKAACSSIEGIESKDDLLKLHCLSSADSTQSPTRFLSSKAISIAAPNFQISNNPPSIDFELINQNVLELSSGKKKFTIKVDELTY